MSEPTLDQIIYARDQCAEMIALYGEKLLPIFERLENEIKVRKKKKKYYKTIVCFKDGEVTGIGFLLKNEKTKDKFFKYATSIDSIEQVTGIDFYQKMDDALEAKIEANKEISEFIKPIN